MGTKGWRDQDTKIECVRNILDLRYLGQKTIVTAEMFVRYTCTERCSIMWCHAISTLADTSMRREQRDMRVASTHQSRYCTTSHDRTVCMCSVSTSSSVCTIAPLGTLSSHRTFSLYVHSPANISRCLSLFSSFLFWSSQSTFQEARLRDPKQYIGDEDSDNFFFFGCCWHVVNNGFPLGKYRTVRRWDRRLVHLQSAPGTIFGGQRRRRRAETSGHGPHTNRRAHLRSPGQPIGAGGTS